MPRRIANAMPQSITLARRRPCYLNSAHDQAFPVISSRGARSAPRGRRGTLPCVGCHASDVAHSGYFPTARRPGQASPGSTPAVHSPVLRCPGKARKSSTTRQYERPGTAGSSSRWHRRTGIRGPAPAERRVNRTQAPRSAPATRLTTGHADRARTRFCPLPPRARSCALP